VYEQTCSELQLTTGRPRTRLRPDNPDDSPTCKRHLWQQHKVKEKCPAHETATALRNSELGSTTARHTCSSLKVNLHQPTANKGLHWLHARILRLSCRPHAATPPRTSTCCLGKGRSKGSRQGWALGEVCHAAICDNSLQYAKGKATAITLPSPALGDPT